MDYQKLFDAKISQKSIAAWRSTGKKALGIVCCHVPHEMLHAADVLPVRLRATDCDDYSDAEVWMSSFSCSFAKSILQYLMDETYKLDGIIASDGCMQAVRIYDNWKWITEQNNIEQFVFELGVPRMRSELTREFYTEGLTELKESIEKLSGNKITDEKLLKSIEIYNEQRRLVRQVLDLQKADNPVITGAQALTIMMAASNMPVEEYNELLKTFLADVSNMKPIEGKRARLMLIGSAVDNPEYLEAIEKNGGIIVADTICLGTMGFGDEIKVDKNNVMRSIADYYLDRVVCPRMIDNRDELHEIILNTAKEYRIDGVIYEKMQNCECWGGENVFLENELKEVGIPILNLEREQKIANLGQLQIRSEAFIEMIEEA